MPVYKKYKYYYGLNDKIIGEGEDFFESYLMAQMYAKELSYNLARKTYPEHDDAMLSRVVYFGVKS